MMIRMVVEMVYNSIFWHNVFPPINGMITTMIQIEKITGIQIYHNHHFTLKFGSY